MKKVAYHPGVGDNARHHRNNLILFTIGLLGILVLFSIAVSGAQELRSEAKGRVGSRKPTGTPKRNQSLIELWEEKTNTIYQPPLQYQIIVK